MHRVNLNQESFNQQVVEHASFGIALVASDGLILTVNPAFKRIFGYTNAEFENKWFDDLAHPDEEMKSMEYFKALMGDDNTEVHFDKRYIKKNGVVLWGLLSVKLFCDEANQPKY
jgi:two-component system, sensor histidine kinase